MTRSPGTAVALVFLFLLPVGVGVGILGAFTIGDALRPHGNEGAIGTAISLITIALLAWYSILSEPPRNVDTRFAMLLVGCGTLCILLALAVQFYVASLGARIADVIRERGGNVNINIPNSVHVMSYLGIFVGIWLAALGVRMAVNRVEAWPPEARQRDVPPPPYARPVETGFRED